MVRARREEADVWERTRREPMEIESDELVLECESLLGGRVAEFLGNRRRRIPPWAWVTVLAHASEDQLAVLAKGHRHEADTGPGTREWKAAVAFLADDVLCEAKSSGTTVLQLQRATLVPLELELMTGSEARVQNPGQLAALVLAALHRHPSARQR